MQRNNVAAGILPVKLCDIIISDMADSNGDQMTPLELSDHHQHQ